MDKLLKVLDENCNYTHAELAAILGTTEQAIAQELGLYEKQGVIRGYKAIIDWDKTDREFVNALIEIKVSPKANLGFDEIAEKINEFEEVESLFLMSGGFDLCAMVCGKTLKEVAFFVAKKLGALDSVLSVSTHFVLKKYKDSGFFISKDETDERRLII